MPYTLRLTHHTMEGLNALLYASAFLNVGLPEGGKLSGHMITFELGS